MSVPTNPAPTADAGLLAAISEALDVPSPRSDGVSEYAHRDLLRHRVVWLSAYLAAIAGCSYEPQIAAATVRQLIAETPVTYALYVPRTKPEPPSCGESACLLPGAHSHHVPRLAVTRTPAAVTAEEWNAAHPVGTPVLAYPLTRDDEPLRTRTRRPAWTLGHGMPVVSVEGHAGGIALTHIDLDGGDRS